MTLQFNRYVFGLALNTIIICALFLYTWKLKKAAGARYFAYALLACLIWDFATVLELSSTILSAKIFFAKVTYFGTVFIANFWFFFAISTSPKYKIINSYKLIWIVPLITLALVLTNGLHKLYGLIYPCQIAPMEL